MTVYPFALPQKPYFVEYLSYDTLFLPHELDRIEARWNAGTSETATVAGSAEQKADESLRKSSLVFLPPDPESHWIFSKLEMVAQQSNYERFGFDVTGFHELLQLAEYGEGDFFTWHMDFGPGMISHRKLSLTVQLSEADAYEGGDLQFMINDRIETAPRTRGSVVIFPSFVMHRVTPVTAGIRRSIVGWVSGPPYR